MKNYIEVKHSEVWDLTKLRGVKNFPSKKCFHVVKHQNIVHAECRYLWKSMKSLNYFCLCRKCTEIYLYS